MRTEFDPGTPEHARHTQIKGLYSLSKELSIVELTLSRGQTGLGFEIKGGTDNKVYEEDPGIFVATLKENGAAFTDGRLKPGDKIIAVNGVDVQMMKHEEAIDVFINAGDSVTLRVQHGAEAFVFNKLVLRKTPGIWVYAVASACFVMVVAGVAALVKSTPSSQV